MPTVPTESSQSSAAKATRVEGSRRTRRFWLSLILFLVDSLAAYAIALYAGAAASNETPVDQTDHRAAGEESPRIAVPSDERSTDSRIGETGSASIEFDKSGRARASDLLDVERCPAAEVQTVTGVSNCRTALWSAAFNFFLNSFAYAAALHRAPTFSLESFEASVTRIRAKGPDEQANENRNDKAQLFDQPSAFAELERVLPSDDSRRTWLNLAWHPFVIRWKNWRRERRIRSAAVVQGELDDQTLLDIDIPQRSAVEDVVRHRADC